MRQSFFGLKPARWECNLPSTSVWGLRTPCQSLKPGVISKNHQTFCSGEQQYFFAQYVLLMRHFLQHRSCKSFSGPILCKHLGFHQKTCLLQHPTAAVLTPSVSATGLWPLLHWGASFLALVLSEKAKSESAGCSFCSLRLTPGPHTAKCSKEMEQELHLPHLDVFNYFFSRWGESRQREDQRFCQIQIPEVFLKYKVLGGRVLSDLIQKCCIWWNCYYRPPPHLGWTQSCCATVVGWSSGENAQS